MKTVSLKLEDNVYKELLRRAREEGFLTVSEYLNSLILRLLESPKTTKQQNMSAPEEEEDRERLIDKLLTLVERKIQSTVNPFTQKVDEINRRVATIIERLEALEDRMNTLEERIKSAEVQHEEVKEQKKVRKTAVDILKEQKVMFESEIASKIKDRDTLFARLERGGAVVIEAKDERIAIDKEFWQSFVQKLKNMKTNNDEELKKMLEPIEFKLLQKLRESALIVFDSSSKSWNLLL